MNTKEEIRKASLQQRMHLSEKRRKEASLNACFALKEICQKENGLILSFASTPLEINLWPFNKWLLSENRLLLPKVEAESLTIYKVSDLSHLENSFHGIKEPNPSFCSKVSLTEIGLILIPGLAFDIAGNRIGYGMGHFDRFLNNLHHTTKWGIGFHEENQKTIQPEVHDISMDKVFFF